MRHHAVLGSALRTNACRFAHHARPISHPPSLSLSKGLLLRAYASVSPNPRHPQPSTARAATNATTATARTTTTTTTTASAAPAAATTATTLAASSANPPSTTRPPPLDLPPAKASTFANLVAKGAAYVAFYKTGLKHILVNTRLARGKPSATDPPLPPAGSRADLHLRLRWRHDLRRLPLFAVMLVVCGELTPFVVLAVPGAVPLTCRIPRQVEQLLRKVEGERAAARGRIAAAAGGEGARAVDVAGILGLRPWGWMPATVVGRQVQERLALLAFDDELLAQAGGAAALVPEEVILACTDRGVDVLGRTSTELRGVLERWLRLTDSKRLGEEGREAAVLRLLNVRDTQWPKLKA